MKSTVLLFSILFFAFSLNAQNVGINTATPDASSLLDLNSANRGLLVPRISIGNVSSASPVVAPATSLLVYNTNAAISGGSGEGFYYWNGSSWGQLGKDNVNNGLNYDAASSVIQLGGLLVKNTIVTQGTFGMTYNLNSTGDFNVQDNGTTHFQVRDNGLTYFGDDTYWNDASVTGTTIARLYDSGNDGVFQVYMNGAIQHSINSVGTTVFNEQGGSYDFRIESNTQTGMFFVDGSTNRIGLNTTAPQNVIDFRTTGENIWLTYWENNNASNGALAQFYQSNAANPNRVLMGITNYSASANAASAVVGLSINTTTTGSGGIGVTGNANNESGTGVEGTLFFSGGYSGWAGYFNADVYCGGTYFGSDRRLKRNINPIVSAIGIIKQLEPVSYFYDTETYPQMGFDENRLTYGFIAQDLEQILPELVKEKNLVLNSNMPKTPGMTTERKIDKFKVVNYTLMIPVLTQAVKEQQEIIEAQSKQIEQLLKVTEELKAAITK